jgi:hypothetical protein
MRTVFSVLEWLAAMCLHIPDSGWQTVKYHEFGITIKHFSTNGYH